MDDDDDDKRGLDVELVNLLGFIFGRKAKRGRGEEEERDVDVSIFFVMKMCIDKYNMMENKENKNKTVVIILITTISNLRYPYDYPI